MMTDDTEAEAAAAPKAARGQGESERAASTPKSPSEHHLRPQRPLAANTSTAASSSSAAGAVAAAVAAALSAEPELAQLSAVQNSTLRRLRAARQELSAQTDASERARKLAAPAIATAARCLSAAAADLAAVFRRANALRKRLEAAGVGAVPSALAAGSGSPPPPPQKT